MKVWGNFNHDTTGNGIGKGKAMFCIDKIITDIYINVEELKQERDKTDERIVELTRYRESLNDAINSLTDARDSLSEHNI